MSSTVLMQTSMIDHTSETVHEDRKTGDEEDGRDVPQDVQPFHGRATEFRETCLSVEGPSDGPSDPTQSMKGDEREEDPLIRPPTMDGCVFLLPISGHGFIHPFIDFR